jgi:DNA-binding HxlR family transcriptional regulator
MEDYPPVDPDAPVLSIRPNELVFSVQSNVSYLQLTNLTPRPVIYKTRTTHPKRYKGSPPQGILLPGAEVAVKVVLDVSDLAADDVKNNRFVVLSYALKDSPADVNKVWEQILSRYQPKAPNPVCHEKVLKCKLSEESTPPAQTDKEEKSKEEKEEIAIVLEEKAAAVVSAEQDTVSVPKARFEEMQSKLDAYEEMVQFSVSQNLAKEELEERVRRQLMEAESLRVEITVLEKQIEQLKLNQEITAAGNKKSSAPAPRSPSVKSIRVEDRVVVSQTGLNLWQACVFALFCFVLGRIW